MCCILGVWLFLLCCCFEEGGKLHEQRVRKKNPLPFQALQANRVEELHAFDSVMIPMLVSLRPELFKKEWHQESHAQGSEVDLEAPMCEEGTV